MVWHPPSVIHAFSTASCDVYPPRVRQVERANRRERGRRGDGDAVDQVRRRIEAEREEQADGAVVKVRRKVPHGEALVAEHAPVVRARVHLDEVARPLPAVVVHQLHAEHHVERPQHRHDAAHQRVALVHPSARVVPSGEARVEALLLDPRPVRGEQRDHALAARLLAGLVEDLHGAALVDDDLGGELEAEVERV